MLKGEITSVRNVVGGLGSSTLIPGPQGIPGPAPRIGENNNWLVWDADINEYVDTGIPATGPQGENVLMRYNEETAQIEWKTESAKEWNALLTLEEVRGDVVASTLAIAQAAVSETAQYAADASVSEKNAAASELAATAGASAAELSAGNAASSASAADSSAKNAKASEANAAASASSASGSAGTATTKAQEAASSAQVAANAQAGAERAEQSAASSASSAQTSAVNAENAKSAAQAAQKAAEDARDAASEIVGGDFASKTEAKGYANTAEANANAYTDDKIAAIPAPDVSGQIATHNSAPDAHADIRALANSKATMEQVNEAISKIPAPDVSGQISAHNSSSTAHGDIRTAVSNAASAAQTAQATANGKEASGTAASLISSHNSNTSAHGDIRTAVNNAASVAAEALAASGSGAKIEMVSYVGTGTYGVNNPCSLTFSYAPKLLIWVGRKYNDNGSIKPPAAGSENAKYTSFMHSTQQLTTSYVSGAGFADNIDSEQCYGKISEDGKTYFWYTTKGASQQLNNTAYTYYFVAIG